MRSRPHDETMAELYRSESALGLGVINGILADGHQAELLIVLRQMAQAFGGVQAVAEGQSGAHQPVGHSQGDRDAVRGASPGAEHRFRVSRLSACFPPRLTVTDLLQNHRLHIDFSLRPQTAKRLSQGSPGSRHLGATRHVP